MLPKIGAFRGKTKTLWRFEVKNVAAIAQANGRLAREITLVEITQSKGSDVVVDCDEHPRQTSGGPVGQPESAVSGRRDGDCWQRLGRERWRGGVIGVLDRFR